MSQDSKVLPKPKRSRKQKVLIWSLATVLVIFLSIAITYSLMVYSPSATAKAAIKSDEQVTVSIGKSGYRFEPTLGEGAIIQPNVIFYPGGLVDAKAYAPLARKLAEAGHRVYIAMMPLNLAIMGQNKADDFMTEHPDESYVMGGHSLGGVFASRYASERLDRVNGVFFLASYADEGGSLVQSKLPVLQITASNDGVLNEEAWSKGKQYMPSSTKYVTIDGGNHAQFGSYGNQKGDLPASIKPEEQLEQMSNELLGWMKGLQAN